MRPDDLEGLSPQGWTIQVLHVGALFVYLSRAPFSFGQWPYIDKRRVSWGAFEFTWHWLPKFGA